MIGRGKGTRKGRYPSPRLHASYRELALRAIRHNVAQPPTYPPSLLREGGCEARPISFHLLIEPLRGDVVEHREVNVQNYPMPANSDYEGVDIFDHSVRSYALALAA